jgi:hypothetical protein
MPTMKSLALNIELLVDMVGVLEEVYNAVPFGGTITTPLHATQHSGGPCGLSLAVAIKDKPAFWVYIGGMTHRRASLTGVHLYRRASYRRVSLTGVHPRRASLTGVHPSDAHLLQTYISQAFGL